MNVTLIQMNAGLEKGKNVEKTLELVREAIDKGAEFILLPEVFNYRGPAKGFELCSEIAEEIPGPSTEKLISLAKENNVHILAGSIYEKIPDQFKVYNTSILIDSNGRVNARYRKIHLFKAQVDGSCIDESETFLAGDLPVVGKVGDFMVGLSICFDLRFPELYREYFKQRVDIIVIPSSFTYRTGEAHWETLLRARAIENQCYVLAPNQVGIDGNGVRTYGHSMIVGPWGDVLIEAGESDASILSSAISIDELRTRRAQISYA